MTVRDARFRTAFHAAIIAVYRGGHQLQGRIGDIVLAAGDTLLLDSTPAFIQRFGRDPRFALVSKVAEQGGGETQGGNVVGHNGNKEGSNTDGVGKNSSNGKQQGKQRVPARGWRWYVLLLCVFHCVWQPFCLLLNIHTPTHLPSTHPQTHSITATIRPLLPLLVTSAALCVHAFGAVDLLVAQCVALGVVLMWGDVQVESLTRSVRLEGVLVMAAALGMSKVCVVGWLFCVCVCSWCECRWGGWVCFCRVCVCVCVSSVSNTLRHIKTHSNILQHPHSHPPPRHCKQVASPKCSHGHSLVCSPLV